MLKLCGPSLRKPLSIVLGHALVKWNFPWNGKKNKYGSDLQKYRPVSLLPICSKILDIILFNEVYTFFNENVLSSSNQSGFRSGGSCINQLLSITHEIYQFLDNDLEVRGVFWDI